MLRQRKRSSIELLQLNIIEYSTLSEQYLKNLIKKTKKIHTLHYVSYSRSFDVFRNVL